MKAVMKQRYVDVGETVLLIIFQQSKKKWADKNRLGFCKFGFDRVFAKRLLFQLLVFTSR
jgi:hypothetical protein